MPWGPVPGALPSAARQDHDGVFSVGGNCMMCTHVYTCVLDVSTAGTTVGVRGPLLTQPLQPLLMVH